MEYPPANLRILDDPPFREAIDLVSDVFHRINRVLPEDQVPLTVPPEKTAREAIAMMVHYGYSQLPIVSAKGSILGVFSYRSFAAKAGRETLDSIKTDRCAPGDLPVDEFSEEFQFARVSDEFQSVFSSMDSDNGILIGSPAHLQGVLTPMDFLRYLYSVASPFVFLSEIELALRALIKSAVTEVALEICIQNSLAKAYEGSSLPKDVTEMTFDNYRTLITDGRNWDLYFHTVFGGTRPRTAAKLKEIRDVRNDVFHFKRDLKAEDLTLLKAHRNWILMKATNAETNKRGDNP